MPRRSNKQASKKQIAHTVKRGLILLIACLIVLLLALMFSVGRDSWSMWMIVHRKQIVGILLLAIFL
ncbi:MAG TPA: hypothetical protein VFQ13_00330, partial [Anaerolineales bacterium]|nr:hypothetical protein [Anaerolineales bacterium]